MSYINKQQVYFQTELQNMNIYIQTEMQNLRDVQFRILNMDKEV